MGFLYIFIMKFYQNFQNLTIKTMSSNFYSTDIYFMNDYFDFSQGTKFLNSFITENIGTYKYGDDFALSQWKNNNIHGLSIKFKLKK